MFIFTLSGAIRQKMGRRTSRLVNLPTQVRTQQAYYLIFKYRTFIFSMLVIICSLQVSALHAQNKQKQNQLESNERLNDAVSLRQNFEPYANNQYLISIPFSKDNIRQLKKRRLIYRYRAIYLSTKDMADPTSGFIHIGFFSSQKDAEEFKQDSLFLFPQQSINKVSRDEHTGVLNSLKPQNTLNTISNFQYYVVAIGPNTTNEFDQTAQDILTVARDAYANKRYHDAAIHYRLLAALADDPEISAWAQELLGLCLERQKLFSDAIETYETILTEYPDTTGIPRVRQRHLGLTTATLDEKGALPKSKASENRVTIFNRGVFGQNFRNFTRAINDEEQEEVLSRIVSDLDLRSSIRWKNHSLKARVNGYYVSDQLDEDESEGKLKRLFLDYQHIPSGTQGTLGRIRDADSGVFTSYDGATFSYPIIKDVRVAISAGIPVYFSDIFNDLDRYFVSSHINWEANKHWHLNSYLTHQTLNGEIDRSALGFRVQHFNSSYSASLNVDYDFAFKELNNLLGTASYSFSSRFHVSGIYGHQRTPFLTATNILVGQPDLDLDLYLSVEENKDTLLEDAFERTSLNEYFTVSLRNKFTENFQMHIDYTHSQLSEIPALELLNPISVEADFDNLSQETFSYDSVGVQIVKQQFFSRSDTLTMGIRASSSDSNDSTYFYLRERFQIGNHFIFQPNISYIRSNIISNNVENSDTNQQIWRYGLSLKFRPWPATEFSLDAGGEDIQSGINGVSFVSNYVFAGYRINF